MIHLVHLLLYLLSGIQYQINTGNNQHDNNDGVANSQGAR